MQNKATSCKRDITNCYVMEQNTIICMVINESVCATSTNMTL